jgi:hypothetical protein
LFEPGPLIGADIAGTAVDQQSAHQLGGLIGTLCRVCPTLNVATEKRVAAFSGLE